MKTKRVIKLTNILIIVMIIASTFHTINVEAKTNLNKNTSLTLLEIRPYNVLLNKQKPSALKLDMDIEKLREIRKAQKEAEELQRKKEEEQRRIEEEQRRLEEASRIVYDGMTMEELSNKLNRSLNSTLSGQGETFARLSIELGIDPYLAVAISMHETGCKWNCSRLVNSCNNIGGMKGSPGCGGGAYASFPTLDEGIRAYMNNLYKNYISMGLTTPEAMGPKYAGSGEWPSKVRAYMNEIKAK